LNLLKGIKPTKKYHLEDLSKVKAWTFESKSEQKTHRINLKRVLYKRPKQLTLELVGFSAVKTPTVLFGIYTKRKTLPLLEFSVDVSKRSVILRYQGATSFQRSTISFSDNLDNWKVLSASINKTHFSVNVGCIEERSLRLTQRLVKLPKRAYGILGSGKNSEDQFAVSMNGYGFYLYSPDPP